MPLANRALLQALASCTIINSSLFNFKLVIWNENFEKIMTKKMWMTNFKCVVNLFLSLHFTKLVQGKHCSTSTKRMTCPTTVSTNLIYLGICVQESWRNKVHPQFGQWVHTKWFLHCQLRIVLHSEYVCVCVCVWKGPRQWMKTILQPKTPQILLFSSSKKLPWCFSIVKNFLFHILIVINVVGKNSSCDLLGHEPKTTLAILQ